MAHRLKISCYNCAQKLDVSDVPAFTRISCPTCSTQLIVPKAFANLLLEEKLGTGLVTAVYRAMDVTLEREIAVKVLLPELIEEPGVPELFISQARGASTIAHRHVVPIYSCGDSHGRPYLVMQWMEGGSLKRQADLKQSPAPRQVCRWFAQALDGLESAQRHGILHHHLSPGCLYLDGDGNLKIGDFGLSQALLRGVPLAPTRDPDLDRRLAPHHVHYLSPERLASGEGSLAADIYSLGCAFYHIVSGRPAFDGRTVPEVIDAHSGPRPPHLGELRRDLPPELTALIMAMMAPDPDQRPADYAAVRAALDEARGHMARDKLTAASGNVPSRRPRPDGAVPPLPPDAPAHRSWLRRLFPILLLTVPLGAAAAAAMTGLAP